MSAADTFTPTLRVCNCAGGTISETTLDKAAPAPGTPVERGRLVTMGWTDGEMLVTVRERGGVELRDIMVRYPSTCNSSMIGRYCVLVLECRAHAGVRCKFQLYKPCATSIAITAAALLPPRMLTCTGVSLAKQVVVHFASLSHRYRMSGASTVCE